MIGHIFDEKDISEILERGMRVEDVLTQIEAFRKGFPKLTLRRACTIGDGIMPLRKTEIERLEGVHDHAARSGRAMKFVPASGAASRMFRPILSMRTRYGEIDDRYRDPGLKRHDQDHRDFLKFMSELGQFAFYNDLRSVMERDGLPLDALIQEGRYREILESLLTPRGLDLVRLPKGLIKFHIYPGHSRTAFEEHLVEAASYVKDGKGVVRVHFTVPCEDEAEIRGHLNENRGQYETGGITFDLSMSTQKPSTDTIAVDMENSPFHDGDGRLLFRPGGHGSLLENLNDLKGDIVFIKNIDNVLPDRLKPETCVYKKALGGYLVETQKQIFGYLGKLLDGRGDAPFIDEVMEFCRSALWVYPPVVWRVSHKIQYLISVLNRPLRVCGMVRNEGEPGGGPFWVEHGDGTTSLQIVESSQVDMTLPGQKAVWESATHFNPVDLVCGVRDHRDSPFHLMDFRDPETGFISTKSHGGREIKALEHPGLWNGSMARWNTIFVEVPTVTFSPVKTVLDLLRKEHRP